MEITVSELSLIVVWSLAVFRLDVCLLCRQCVGYLSLLPIIRSHFLLLSAEDSPSFSIREREVKYNFLLLLNSYRLQNYFLVKRTEAGNNIIGSAHFYHFALTLLIYSFRSARPKLSHFGTQLNRCNLKSHQNSLGRKRTHSFSFSWK